MTFEWDKAKAAANLKKHLISFPFAARVFLDTNRIERPDEGSHTEQRWITVGLVDDLEILVVYTLRGESVRLISARKAERYEREEYWNS